MRVAALDLGSNSFLLLIAEKSSDGLRVLHDQAEVTRLAQGVNESRRLHPQALDRAKQCLTFFKKKMDEFSVTKILAVSTSAARDAENGNELIAIGNDLGIPIQIIQGQEEADLTYLGATYDLSPEEGTLVVDVGGGSTEIIAEENSCIKGLSLNIGSVRLTEMFITQHPIADDEMSKMVQYIKSQFSKKSDSLPRSSKKLIAVAGTPSTMACVAGKKEFSPLIHGSSLTLVELESWQEKLKNMNISERESLIGMQVGRADVIVAGLTILIESLKYYQMQQITVSIKGVRFGLAFSMAK